MRESMPTDEINSIEVSEFDSEEKVEPQLPPIDRGRRAWSFLIGAFMIEGLLYGFPLLFGVFQEHLRVHASFGNDPFLPNVGSLSIGIAKLLSPIMTPIIIRYQAYRRQMLWGGWLLCMIALVIASFATELWHLVFFQGFLFGIGWMILYYPLLSLMNEWFVVRRGLAYGVLFGSEGLFGLGLPILMEILLEKYGYAWTLRIYAIATLVLVGPTLPLLYGRNPIDPAASKSVKMAPGIFSKVAFTTISWANIFQGLVVYIPTLLFPPFATAIGLSTSQGTLILSITNVATIVGMVGLGALADKIDSQLLSSASSLGASLASFFLWGYSTNFILLLFFSIAQGMFAAGYSVLYSRFATSVAPGDPESQTWLYSVFEAQRGALIIAGGIMGGVLVGAGGEVRSGVYGVGRYQSTVLVVGTSFALSALGVVGWWFRGERWRFQKPIIMVNMEEERLKKEGKTQLWQKIGEKPPTLPELKLDYHH